MTWSMLCVTIMFTTHSPCSDEPLRGPIQAFDFDSDDEPDVQEPVLKSKKSKQSQRPSKIIPTGSDKSSSDEEDSDDEEERITMANMEARSRALDAKADAEAELDVEEMMEAAEDGDDEDAIDLDGEGGEDGEIFRLPTAEQRDAEEKSGGPDVQGVQRRIQEITRVLGRFKKLGEKGRYVLPSFHLALMLIQF